MTTPPSPFTAQFHSLLDAGCPRPEVARQLRQHIAALEDLPEDTEDRQAALNASKALLEDLEKPIH